MPATRCWALLRASVGRRLVEARQRNLGDSPPHALGDSVTLARSDSRFGCSPRKCRPAARGYRASHGGRRPLPGPFIRRPLPERHGLRPCRLSVCAAAPAWHEPHGLSPSRTARPERRIHTELSGTTGSTPWHCRARRWAEPMVNALAAARSFQGFTMGRGAILSGIRSFHGGAIFHGHSAITDERHTLTMAAGGFSV